jgi:hypothetical protein
MYIYLNIFMMFYDFIRKVWGLVRNWSLLVYLGLLCCGKANRSAFHKPLEFTVWKISTSLSRHPFVKHVHSHLHVAKAQKNNRPRHHHQTKTKNTENEALQCTVQSGLKKMLEFETKPEPTGTWVLHEQIGIHKLYQCCLLLKAPEGKCI